MSASGVVSRLATSPGNTLMRRYRRDPTPALPANAGSREWLAGGLSELGVSAAPEALDRLNAYLDMLTHWSRAHGLTAPASPGELVVRHVLDSAAVLPFLPPGPKLDAGSGAGLPGLVLAILRPATEWLLLDSAARKVAFIRHVRGELDLSNVHVVRERLEQYNPEEPPGAIVARALAPLPKLVALAAHLLRRGSLLVAMLGRRPSEKQLLALPGVTCRSIRRIHVPGLEAKRHVAVLACSQGASAPGAES